MKSLLHAKTAYPCLAYVSQRYQSVSYIIETYTQVKMLLMPVIEKLQPIQTVSIEFLKSVYMSCIITK